MLEEFKKFAMRGNVVDLAVGVIIGAAFGAIVSSLVGDVIMPVIGAVTGGLDFSNYYLPLSSKVQAGLSYADAKKQGAVLGWGQFITVALNFVIIAFVLFLAIKESTNSRRKSRLRHLPDLRLRLSCLPKFVTCLGNDEPNDQVGNVPPSLLSGSASVAVRMSGCRVPKQRRPN